MRGGSLLISAPRPLEAFPAKSSSIVIGSVRTGFGSRRRCGPARSGTILDRLAHGPPWRPTIRPPHFAVLIGSAHLIVHGGSGASRLRAQPPRAATGGSPRNEASRRRSRARARVREACPGRRGWAGMGSPCCGCHAPALGALERSLAAASAPGEIAAFGTTMAQNSQAPDPQRTPGPLGLEAACQFPQPVGCAIPRSPRHNLDSAPGSPRPSIKRRSAARLSSPHHGIRSHVKVSRQLPQSLFSSLYFRFTLSAVRSL